MVHGNEKSKEMKRTFFFSFLLAASVLSAADLVILQTEEGKETEIIAGDAKLTDKKVTPASTFKIVLAWTGLELGLVGPETRRRCEDSHVPGTPREISLREATFYSSNDYFVWLAKKIGPEKLREHVQHSGFIAENLPDDWLEEGVESVVRAGKLKVNARQQHAFILRVMRGQLASAPSVQKKLMTCLEWPTNTSEILLYGKTGSYNRTVWFNGFGREGKKWKAVTVLMVGRDAKRDKAIELFYNQWGLKPSKLKIEDGATNAAAAQPEAHQNQENVTPSFTGPQVGIERGRARPDYLVWLLRKGFLFLAE